MLSVLYNKTFFSVIYLSFYIIFPLWLDGIIVVTKGVRKGEVWG